MSRSTLAGLASGALVVTAIVVACVVSVADSDPGVQIGDVAGLVVLIALPPALAVGLLVGRFVGAVVGHDVPERLLTVATAGLRGSRATWGAAMRAELAAIDAHDERRRFAVGCALTALRTGWNRSALLVAVTAGGGLAAITLVSSRMSLAGDRTGSLLGVLTAVTPLVLLAVAGGAAFVGASFRSGLEYGFLALLVALVGITAVAIPEGARWAEVGGVYLLDGDAPPVPLSARAGAIDALRSTLVFGPLVWLSWPVIGAQFGVSLRRRRSPQRPGEYDQPSYAEGGRP
ncbi:MAG: hypothetical protein ACRDO0_02315 [Nocardioidaceae bacterium]